jgi:uncharacterized membrane protein
MNELRPKYDKQALHSFLYQQSHSYWISDITWKLILLQAWEYVSLIFKQLFLLLRELALFQKVLIGVWYSLYLLINKLQRELT